MAVCSQYVPPNGPSQPMTEAEIFLKKSMNNYPCLVVDGFNYRVTHYRITCISYGMKKAQSLPVYWRKSAVLPCCKSCIYCLHIPLPYVEYQWWWQLPTNGTYPKFQMATTEVDTVISYLSGYFPLGWRLSNYRTCGPFVHPLLFLHVFEVLGDALGPGDVLTDAATRGLGVTASTAKRTASPGTLPTGTLPVLNQSSGEAMGGLGCSSSERVGGFKWFRHCHFCFWFATIIVGSLIGVLELKVENYEVLTSAW